jgi:hypothetical protein
MVRSIGIRLRASLFGLALVSLAAPLLAHHSFAAEYDADKPVKLTGTVTKLDWRNPHIWVYLDVKNADGEVVKWQCEGGSPSSLRRQGWHKDSVPTGEQLTIDGYLAKDGTNTCNSRTWTLANGRHVFAGSSGPGSPDGRGQP